MKTENITSSIEEITPAIAQMWLDNSNTKNRTLSQAIIESYADTMKNGNWLVNGEAITFDDKGNLLNGHHRLRAIIASTKTIKSFVVRGVDPKSFTTYDCGRNRTFGQLICMQGTANGNTVASIVKNFLAFKSGATLQNSALKNERVHETNKSMMDYFLKNKEYFTNISIETKRICGEARVLNCSFVGGSIAYLTNILGYTDDVVVDFFEQLCSTETAKNETINVLRKRLLKERNDRKLRVLNQVHMALAIKCFNAYVTGKKVKIFNWSPDIEGFPKYIAHEEIINKDNK